MMMMMTCHICGYGDGGDNDFDLVDGGNIKDEFFLLILELFFSDFRSDYNEDICEGDDNDISSIDNVDCGVLGVLRLWSIPRESFKYFQTPQHKKLNRVTS